MATGDLTIGLDYARGDDWRGRRWRNVTAGLSVAVGSLGIGWEGVPRLLRAWRYVFGPPADLSFPPSTGLAIAYLPVAAAVLAASVLLVVAGLTTFWRPTLGDRLHAVYALTMLPLAGLLALLIGAFCSLDPVAPPALTLLVVAINGAWYAAYPAFVAFVVWRKLNGFEFDVGARRSDGPPRWPEDAID